MSDDPSTQGGDPLRAVLPCASYCQFDRYGAHEYDCPAYHRPQVRRYIVAVLEEAVALALVGPERRDA